MTSLERGSSKQGPGYGAGVSPGKDHGSLDGNPPPANRTSRHLWGTAVRSKLGVSEEPTGERITYSLRALGRGEGEASVTGNEVRAASAREWAQKAIAALLRDFLF